MPKFGFHPDTVARMNALFAGKVCCECGEPAGRMRTGYVNKLRPGESPPPKRRRVEYYYCHECFQGEAQPLTFREHADTLPGRDRRRRA